MLAQIQLEIKQTCSAEVGLWEALGAGFFAFFAHTVHWSLVFFTALLFASWVDVEDVAIFTGCACVYIASAFWTVFSTTVALAGIIVVNLSFKLALFGTLLMHRIIKHIASTTFANKRRSCTSFTTSITRNTFLVLQNTDLSRTTFQALLLVQKLKLTALVTGITRISCVRTSFTIAFARYTQIRIWISNISSRASFTTKTFV